MENIKMCAPCLFGLEGLAGEELRRLKMTDVSVFDGRVNFSGNMSDIARANINLRTAERILIIAGEFDALSFDALFEGTKAIAWENFIPKNGEFPVKGYSLNSKLHSIPDCQSIIKKAVAERLKLVYKTDWFKEDGAKFQIQFAIIKDRAILYIDTTGAGLHKRGYRAVSGDAPLRETLAAAMVLLSRYKGRGVFLDPFCGSGTIPVEAALIAKNRAPGLNRTFSAENWEFLPKSVWKSVREDAISREFDGEYEIQGGDINPKNITLAKSNAKKAGVSDCINFFVSDIAELTQIPDGVTIVSNPPYGERIMEKSEAEALYVTFGEVTAGLDNSKLYILSSHTEFERSFGKKATKKRKLYNGMIKCDLYMYY